jgi:hypothetical protein
MKKEIKSEEKHQVAAENTRRKFLKKAAYSAPALMAMGQLVKPTEIHADGTGGPDGSPGWNP